MTEDVWYRRGLHVRSLSALMLLGACTPKEPAADDSTTIAASTMSSEAPTSEESISGTGMTSNGSVEPPACMNVTMTEVTTTAGESSESGGTTGDGLCLGGPISNGCCCFEADEPQKDIHVVCDATFPCPDIELYCSEDDLFSCGALITACDAAIDCALDVLILGEPAGIRWGYDHYNYQGDQNVLYLAGDGTAFRKELSWADVSGGFNTIDRRSLNSAEFFMQCKQRVTAMERFDCIEHALESLNNPPEVCVAGFGFDWY